MTKRVLFRSLLLAALLTLCFSAAALGEIYYQSVPVMDGYSYPYCSIPLQSCGGYLHIDEYGTETKEADSIYVSPDKEASLSADGMRWTLPVWPDAYNPMHIESCEVWELPWRENPSYVTVLLALHWRSHDKTQFYVSDMVFVVDAGQEAWGHDYFYDCDQMRFTPVGENRFDILVYDRDEAWVESETQAGGSDIIARLNRGETITAELPGVSGLEEDRFYTWSKGQKEGFQASGGIYLTLDDVKEKGVAGEPYSSILSYRLGRALYDPQDHRQVATVYTRVEVNDIAAVSSIEDIVWLQSAAAPAVSPTATPTATPIATPTPSPTPEPNLFIFSYNDDDQTAAVLKYIGAGDTGVAVPETTRKGDKTYRVISIDENAFQGTAITGVSLPDTILLICKGAFKNCSRLTSLYLPDSLYGIETEAFAGCGQLTDVSFGAALSLVEDGAFLDCPSLTDFTVRPENHRFRVNEESGALCEILSTRTAGEYTYRQERLLCVPAGRRATDVVIPYEVAFIAPHAFSGCTELHDVTIANSETAIADLRFDVTTHLRLLVYQDSQAERDAQQRGWNYARIFDWDSDRVKFLNQAIDYHSPNYSGEYIITEESLHQLVKDMPPTVRLHIYVEKRDSWIGSCYGMCTTAQLHRLNRLNCDKEQLGYMLAVFGTDNMYKLPYPKDELMTSDLMSYYYLSQFLPNAKNKSVYANSVILERARQQATGKVYQEVLDGEIQTAIDSLLHGIPIQVSLQFGDKGHAIIFERILSIDKNCVTIGTYDPNCAKMQRALIALDGSKFYTETDRFLIDKKDECIFYVPWYSVDEMDLINYYTGNKNGKLQLYYNKFPTIIIDGERVSEDDVSESLKLYEFTANETQRTPIHMNLKLIPHSDGNSSSSTFLLENELPEQLAMEFTGNGTVALLDERYPFILNAESGVIASVDYANQGLAIQGDASGALSLTLSPENGASPGGDYVTVAAEEASSLIADWQADGLHLSTDSKKPLSIELQKDGKSITRTIRVSSDDTVITDQTFDGGAAQAASYALLPWLIAAGVLAAAILLVLIVILRRSRRRKAVRQKTPWDM